MADASARVRFLWGEQFPLTPDNSASALAFWINKSATDPWTFGDLKRLLGQLMDDGLAIPPALDAWAREVAAGRREAPRRTGPKGDRTRDFRIAGVVAMLQDFGMSQRAAVQFVARTTGKSAQAVHSARRRGLGV